MYIYHLAGENLELAEAELNGFLEATCKDVNISRKGRLAFTESHPSQLKRLALTHEVAEKIDIANYRPEGSFKVRVENLTEKDVDNREAESTVGRKLSTEDNFVDLENPDTIIKIYIMEDEKIYGRQIEDIPRGLYEDRSNEKRPFSSPVSLDPVLARVMVNLSGLPAGTSILDPFCGTGGILIEAGFCGIGVNGLDIQNEMVEGCIENLENYGILNHRIKLGDISKADELFNDYDAIVSDLPYGKASKKEQQPVEKFINFIDGFEGKVVFMYNEASIGNYEADYDVYVHKNLTRFIFVV